MNNTRDDKLLTPMWKASFLQRRCLIPLSQWAEAEGAAGRMTRTWYALHDVDLFAVAGLWRQSEEWGEVYSMVMTDACSQMTEVHDRMPVILRPEHWEHWTTGTADDALSLVRKCDDALAVERSGEPWVAKKAAGAGTLIQREGMDILVATPRDRWSVPIDDGSFPRSALKFSRSRPDNGSAAASDSTVAGAPALQSTRERRQ